MPYHNLNSDLQLAQMVTHIHRFISRIVIDATASALMGMKLLHEICLLDFNDVIGHKAWLHRVVRRIAALRWQRS